MTASKKKNYKVAHVGKGLDRVPVKMSGSPLNRKQAAFQPCKPTIFKDSVLHGQEARSIQDVIRMNLYDKRYVA
jgi:hypothetical protein